MPEFRNQEETQVVDRHEAWSACRGHKKVGTMNKVNLTRDKFDGKRKTETMPKTREPGF
jgi:hypothetical protein